MSIQWFPGHMHITRKAIGERVKEIDVVIEMLDDRLAREVHVPGEPLDAHCLFFQSDRIVRWGVFSIGPAGCRATMIFHSPHPKRRHMSITVKIDLGYEFDVRAKAAEVFDVLSDVPTSVSHFPKVEQLTDLGDGVYKWEMEKVGTAQVNIQTIYASKYISDKARGTVKWTPVKGVGNALVGGHWKIVDKKKSTGVTLAIQGEIEVPLPGLMKMIVVPVVQGEFEKLVEKYIDNLIQRFGGEA